MKIRIKLKDDDKATVQSLPKDEFDNSNQFKLIMSTKSKLDNSLPILFPYDAETNSVSITKNTIANFFIGLKPVNSKEIYSGRDYGKESLDINDESDEALIEMFKTGKFEPYRKKLNTGLLKEQVQKSKSANKKSQKESDTPITRKPSEFTPEDFINAGYSEGLSEVLTNAKAGENFRMYFKNYSISEITKADHEVPPNIISNLRLFFSSSKFGIGKKILMLSDGDKKNELITKMNNLYKLAKDLASNVKVKAIEKEKGLDTLYKMVIETNNMMDSIIATLDPSTKVTDSLTFDKDNIDYDAFQDLRSRGLPKAMFKFDPENIEIPFKINKGFFKRKLEESGLKDISVKTYNSVVRAINMLTLDLILDEGLEEKVLTMINCLNNINHQSVKTLYFTSIEIINPGEYSRNKREELDEIMKKDQEERDKEWLKRSEYYSKHPELFNKSNNFKE